MKTESFSVWFTTSLQVSWKTRRKRYAKLFLLPQLAPQQSNQGKGRTQEEKNWNLKKNFKIPVGVVLNERCHGSFSKVCSWKFSKLRFPVTGNYLFSMYYFQNSKRWRRKPPRSAISKRIFFGRTELHVWDICHKTLCLEHLVCSSWQLWETQGAAQNKIFPFLSCVKMQHHEPLLLLCSSIWRRRKEKPDFV